MSSGIFQKILEKAEVVRESLSYDAVVIGGGIAGMEASLDLAEMGYRVLLVRRSLRLAVKCSYLVRSFQRLTAQAVYRRLKWLL